MIQQNDQKLLAHEMVKCQAENVLDPLQMPKKIHKNPGNICNFCNGLGDHPKTKLTIF